MIINCVYTIRLYQVLSWGRKCFCYRNFAQNDKRLTFATQLCSKLPSLAAVELNEEVLKRQTLQSSKSHCQQILEFLGFCPKLKTKYVNRIVNLDVKKYKTDRILARPESPKIVFLWSIGKKFLLSSPLVDDLLQYCRTVILYSPTKFFLCLILLAENFSNCYFTRVTIEYAWRIFS